MPSLQNLKYINISFGIICITVCIFCICVEIKSYIAHKGEYANIILFSFTIVHVVSCILLIIGVKLMNYNFLIPWMTCLPLTILNFNVLFLLVLKMVWSIMTSMMISIAMWLFVLNMFLKLLKEKRRAKAEMPSSSILAYQLSVSS
ncbi:uncharacterized protein LOC108653761 [Drosophila navojoa]|uniref:uncharacterized protein LOC108653761 n=1 Tax=Drosophila navojoa TaxID=7232 RepID=UPI000846C1C0|nr:uncharacterized protein LOC108653761 [Drosophila navojoa]